MRFLVKMIKEDLEGEIVRSLEERCDLEILLADFFNSKSAFSILLELAMSSANWTCSQSSLMCLLSLET